MMFVYASDHYSTMAYATLAAQVALICKGYGLTTLATTWFNSAVAAYDRALALSSDFTVRDAYYITQLDTPNKMGWTNAQYNEVMGRLTALAVVQQNSAAAALYRYLGQAAGQNPYGNLIEGPCFVSVPTIGAGSGGSGYAVGDLIQLNGGTAIAGARAIVKVTGVSSGAVTTVAIYFPGNYTAAPRAPFTQLSTTGSGTGFSFSSGGISAGTYSVMASANPNIGNYDYVVTRGNNATAKNYMLTRSGGASAQNSAFYASTSRSFNSMQAVNNTTSINYPNTPLANIMGHLMEVVQKGIPASASSILLKSMSSHIQWMMGANLPGKCMSSRYGVRYTNDFLHEEQFKMGVPMPPGLVSQAYFSFATGGYFAFNGTGTNTDGRLTSVADNTNGTNEGLIQPGSTKMWNGWRFGESFWEFKCESRWTTVYVAEFTLERMLLSVATALYVHGWDGNV